MVRRAPGWMTHPSDMERLLNATERLKCYVINGITPWAEDWYKQAYADWADARQREDEEAERQAKR
jgi:hypothetical protein